MIPQFPEFKKLAFSDKDEMEKYTEKYASYSDFEFGSLYSWDVKEKMELSCLNGNLVVKFTDYITGKPFYSFLGTTDVADTASTLITFSIERDCGSNLEIVPEDSVRGLDMSLFTVEESRDHFDYMYDMRRHTAFEGSGLKNHRNLLSSFFRKHDNYQVELLDLSGTEVQKEVLALYKRWEGSKGFIVPNEAIAYARFLGCAPALDHVALGVRVAGTLAAFNVTLLSKKHCIALFEKADTHFTGIYAFLMHEVSKDLLKRGYTQLNYEQDLGIPNLRHSKMSLDPKDFLKKYKVSLKGAVPSAALS